MRTIFQPERCSCQPCGNLTVSLVFMITSGADSSPVVGATVLVNNGTLVTNDIGIASTNRPVSDIQVSVVIIADNHSSVSFSVQILPPGPTIVSVILSPVERRSLGSSSTDLTVPISSIAAVEIPANSILNDNGTPFNGTVTAEINIFTSDSDNTYSDSFPPEIVTEEEGSMVFYQSLVLARTELVDEAGNSLTVNSTNPIMVELTLDVDQPDNVTVLLLLFNDTTGVWVVHSNFTFTRSRKRQAGTVTGAVTLPNPRLFWSICLPIQPSDIVYLQVRVPEDAPGANVDVESNDAGFFLNTALTEGSSMVCMEVMRSDMINGVIRATFNEMALTPSAEQPNGFTVSANTITFTDSTIGPPFYPTQSACMAPGSNAFVSFDPLVAAPSTDIPPEDDDVPQGFWFIQAQVLSCSDANTVSALSQNIDTNVLSLTRRAAAATAGAPIVPISTDIIPSVCTGTVTARTVCLQVFPNSRVTVEAEQSGTNTANGNLCYLSAVSNQVDPALLTNSTFSVTLDLGNTLIDNNPEQGIYFDADSMVAASLRCDNNIGQPVPLGGSFVQFECFERKLMIT